MENTNHQLSISNAQFINQCLCFAQKQGKSMVAYLLPKSNKITLIIGQEEVFDGSLENQKTGFIFSGFSGLTSPKIILADTTYTLSDRILNILIDPDNFLTEINTNSEATPELQDAPIETVVSVFEQNVSKAIKQIKDGYLKKVVLARQKPIEITNTNPGAIFEKLSKGFENSFRSLLYSSNYGIWVGASPEILVSVNENKQFKTVALAGTQKLAKNRILLDAVWKQKEIEEQALVSRYIINCFKTLRLREFEEEGPKTVIAGDLLHLKTVFQANINNGEVQNLASKMLNLLHPTSAVGGMPRQEAIEFINQHEGFDRQLFAGYLGPVNVENRTDLYVNIRCAKLYKNRAILFAGAGITADSDPDREFQETEIKMNVIGKILKF